MPAFIIGVAMRARSVSLAVAIGFAVACLSCVGSAQGRQFQPGDVLMASSSGLQELTPNGTVVQTIPGTDNAGPGCFSPSGQYLVLPGTGLLSRFGQSLASDWANVPDGYCVVDGYGNVFMDGDVDGQVSEYTITGTLERTIMLPPFYGVEDVAIALGPNPCVLYYGGWEDLSGISRYNVCTNTPLAAFNGDELVDALAVLQDGRVIRLTDYSASLYDSSGSPTGVGYPSPFQSDIEVRWMAVDPGDGSVYVSALAGVARYDINSGTLLDAWGANNPSLPPTQQTFGGPMNVYAPPLAGSADIGPNTATLQPGVVTATQATAGFSGTPTELDVFLDGSSQSTSLQLGLYANNHGRPGQLLTQGTITDPTPGQWNYAPVQPSTALTAGTAYWIAVLSPTGSGSVAIRTGGSARIAWTITDVSALPTNWGQTHLTVTHTPSVYGS